MLMLISRRAQMLSATCLHPGNLFVFLARHSLLGRHLFSAWNWVNSNGSVDNTATAAVAASIAQDGIGVRCAGGG